VNEFLHLCRDVNVVLGITAGFAIGWRAVLGFARREVAYRPLFIEFLLCVLLVTIGSAYSIHVGRTVTPITPAWTALLASITITCLFVGGKKGTP
jgi:hypothetical protein